MLLSGPDPERQKIYWTLDVNAASHSVMLRPFKGANRTKNAALRLRASWALSGSGENILQQIVAAPGCPLTTLTTPHPIHNRPPFLPLDLLHALPSVSGHKVVVVVGSVWIR